MLRRALLIGAALLGIAAGRGEGHALLRSSVPSDGLRLARPPAAVRLTFTEEPEPRLSVVRVLDSSGRAVHRGRALPEAGDPSTLSVALEALPNGVYTIAWRTVSRIDGHLTSGALTFGVGVDPIEAADSSAAPPYPPLLGLAGRWAFYFGTAALLGAASVWAAVFASRPPWHAVFAAGAWTIAMAGAVLLAVGQWLDSDVALGVLFSTSVGRALFWRAAPLFVAGGLLLVIHRAAPQRRRLPLIGLGLLVAAALLAHSLAGHAAALGGPQRWAAVSLQWLHMAAIGIWLGGLAALLAVIRWYEGNERWRAVRRYSTAAGVLVGLVILTGLIRTVEEVGNARLLFSTLPGRIILLKIILIIGIAALGAVNRFQNVPRSAVTVRGLRRVGAAEVVLAGIALAAAGGLASMAPARMTEQVAGRQVEATGSDFGTSVRAALQVRPGRPGVNSFVLRLTDFDTRVAIDAPRVSLRFTPLDRRDVGPSNLDLRRRAPGVYHGRGSQLALPGRWAMTVTLERGADSKEVNLTLVLPDRQAVEPVAGPDGLPIYQIALPEGTTISAYLDPARPGRNQLHLTFFDSSGSELGLPSLPSVFAVEDGRPGRPWAVTRFGKGHFVADGDAPGRVTRLSIVAPVDGAGLVETQLVVRF